MGCGLSKGDLRKYDKNSLNRPTVFPLSPFQKNIIKNSWGIIKQNSLTFGTGIFIRLFTKHPEMSSVFPEFKGLASVAEIEQWTVLQGHPRKIYHAFDEAVESIDNGALFIEKIEKLGEKHSKDIKDIYLTRMCEAVVLTVASIIPEEEKEQHLCEVWTEFFSFIAKLMKVGIQRRIALQGDFTSY